MKIRESVTFPLPRKKGIVSTCKECKKLTPTKYASCLGPCNHLVSYLANEARAAAIRATSKKSWG